MEFTLSLIRRDGKVDSLWSHLIMGILYVNGVLFVVCALGKAYDALVSYGGVYGKWSFILVAGLVLGSLTYRADKQINGPDAPDTLKEIFE